MHATQAQKDLFVIRFCLFKTAAELDKRNVNEAPCARVRVDKLLATTHRGKMLCNIKMRCNSMRTKVERISLTPSGLSRTT